MITAEQSGAGILRAAALSRDWQLGSSSGFDYCFLVYRSIRYKWFRQRAMVIRDNETTSGMHRIQGPKVGVWMFCGSGAGASPRQQSCSFDSFLRCPKAILGAAMTRNHDMM